MFLPQPRLVIGQREEDINVDAHQQEQQSHAHLPKSKHITATNTMKSSRPDFVYRNPKFSAM
jgi:hypothetical protein